MSNIHVMSENLANKIAAGEVVERISSVVKELVENSIDAKSLRITVDLIDSGFKSIKVTDDGVGMDKEDARMSFTRHATSKILKEDDLFFINTLGFRGEALPSIASVSKVDLKTCDKDIGTHVVIHGGKEKLCENYQAIKGTIIEVNDLFYNTPARLKYLKSEATELANVTSFIEKLALANINIAFKLTNNGRVIVSTSGSNDLLKTIFEIYGLTVSSNMIKIESSNEDYTIDGYIGKPSILKSNRNHFNTFVNGRIIKNASLNQVINESYHTYKPDIKYPIVVINIFTDPTLIDVNIHPSKQDINFSKFYSLEDLIKNTIKESLKKALLIPNIEVNKKTIDYPSLDSNNYEVFEDNSYEENEYNDQITLDFKTNNIDNLKSINKSKEENEFIKKLELYPVGVVMGTYIIAQNNEGMYLIDQHAAQERINYERVLHALKDERIYTTSLLIPLSLELTNHEAQKIKEHMDILNNLGFKIEEFGINTFVVKEHPTWLIKGMENESIKKIFDIIIEEKHLFDRVIFQDKIAATMACKMSVKGNEAITLEQASKLLEDLVLCDNPYNCPHGRPTIITFTKYELEKMFKRVMN